jgi:5'-3' exonuclease
MIENDPEIKDGKVSFEVGSPFAPFQQLMSVLPPVSAGPAGLPPQVGY